MKGLLYLLLSLLFLAGGSIGGTETGVLRVVLLGGTNGLERTDMDGLPAEVDLTDAA